MQPGAIIRKIHLSPFKFSVALLSRLFRLAWSRSVAGGKRRCHGCELLVKGFYTFKNNFFPNIFLNKASLSSNSTLDDLSLGRKEGRRAGQVRKEGQRDPRESSEKSVREKTLLNHSKGSIMELISVFWRTWKGNSFLNENGRIMRKRVKLYVLTNHPHLLELLEDTMRDRCAPRFHGWCLNFKWVHQVHWKSTQRKFCF